MKQHPAFALLCLFGLLAPAAAAQSEDYGAVYLRSWHLGTTELNDATPGLGFGRRWTLGAGGGERHLEGGVFLNSYDEISPFLIGGLGWPVAAPGPGEIWIGASIGTARYETQARQLREEYGLPSLGGFVPLVALTASYRLGKTDIRLTTVPPGEGVTAVFHLSIGRAF